MILCAVLKFTMVRLGQSEKKADRVVDHLDIRICCLRHLEFGIGYDWL